MKIAGGRHASEDTLEAYQLNRISGEPLENLEEHLLICEQCRRNLDLVTIGIQELKQGLAAYQQISAPTAPAGNPKVTRWAKAAAVVAILILPAAFLVTQTTDPTTVELAPFRAASGEPSVPAGKIKLVIARDGLPVLASYGINVVDDQGRTVWQGAATISGGRLVATPDQELVPGHYWVRVVDSASRMALSEMGLLLLPKPKTSAG